MNKCIVSDVDGTLLIHGDVLNVAIKEETIQAIQTLKEHGVHFAIASGRTHVTKSVFEKQLGFKLDFIGSNGASVIVNDELVVDQTLPWDFYERLSHQIANQHLDINLLFVDSDGHHIFDQSNGWNEKVFLKMFQSGEIQHYFEGSVWDWRKKNPLAKQFNKAVITVKNIDDRDQIFELLRPFVKEENIDMFFSAAVYVEIMPKGVNKATGVEAMSNILGFNPHEIAVVGDSFNDAAMFERFYENSFVMQSAEPDVLNKAKYVVTCVDEVVEKVIKKNLNNS